MSLVTEAIAKEAIELGIPTIERLLKRYGTRKDFYLLVALRNSDGTHQMLAEQFFGDIEACEAKYKPIAHGKASISARTGLSSREVQLMHPELVDGQDVIYWGSVIQGDIIVAGSGVQAFNDEAVAKIIMTLIMALLQYIIEDNRKIVEQGGDFFFTLRH
jgi:hypothetical protein